ncbi:MAG: hypoxanthine phosphoribosyltransferase [Deltaproteobacteria bacterium]|nr:hypoxanthine phosphoribosyltransferase [Deltaproteobacteria bacterium]
MGTRGRTEPFDILISEKAIQERIVALGAEIDRDLKDGDLVVVGVLKGSFVFMADLIRAIKRPVSCDFIRVASYDHDHSTGVVRLEFDLTQPIADKSVLLIEDIVDTGRTLRFLLKYLQAKRPARIRVASLLYKEINPEVRGFIDYCGFTVPDKYVVGYGLDSEGLYRSLPHIGCRAEER